MSWDLILMDCPPSTSSPTEVEPGFVAAPLGSYAEIAERVRTVAPDADFDESGAGVITRLAYVVEFDLGSTEPVESVGLQVHGSGDEVVGLIVGIAEQLNARAIDLQADEYLTPESGRESLQAWQDYRNQVVQRPAAEPKRRWWRRGST